MTKQIHLAGFLIASQVTHSHAMWRHPRASLNFLDPDYYQTIARAAERGFFDFVFFADVLAIPSRFGGDFREAVASGVQAAVNLDPSYVVLTMAAQRSARDGK